MFRIGDFRDWPASPIKTLRHHDEAGPLRPLHVDRQSGYRYYAVSVAQ